MKRKPTAKSLRAGQTIYFSSLNASLWPRMGVVRCAVLPDSSPMPPPNVKHHGYPRWYILRAIEEGTAPSCISYSRRVVQRWVNDNQLVKP